MGSIGRWNWRALFNKGPVMRTSLSILLFAQLLSCAGFCGAQTPAPGKQVAASTTVTVKGDDGAKNVTLQYLLYLPNEYDTKAGEKWPLVLFLHGSGERGDDLEKLKIHGPPKLADQGKEFPFVLVSPQCPAGSRWSAEEL